MNIRIAWKDLAEIIAISAIVASLIFVGLQMQQTQSIALSGVMAANIGHRIETNNVSAERILADYAGFLYRNPGIYQRWVAKEKKLIADRSVLLGAEFSLDAWVNGMRTRVEKLKKAQEGN